jgi:hypothetical protein
MVPGTVFMKVAASQASEDGTGRHMKGRIFALLAFCAVMVLMASPALGQVDPAVSGLSISPSLPSDADNLACSASFTDADGNLDSARFRWIQDSVIVRTVDYFISGSSAAASDTLSGALTNPGGQVYCRVTVYDGTGRQVTADSATVTIAGPPNTPPVVSGLPDWTIQQGDSIPSQDLWGYTSDAQDPDSALTFSILSQSNPSVISCFIYSGRFLSCNSAASAGITDVAVQARDTGSLTGTDTFRITVLSSAPSQRSPSVDRVRIAPSFPGTDDDLTCEADLSDRDGDLHQATFDWFIDGDLFRTRTKGIAGSSDRQTDFLDSSDTGRGDDIRCQVTAYDSGGRSGSGSDSVTVEGRRSEDECGVSVYGLRADEGGISAVISNTGRSYERIGYLIYIDGELVRSDSVALYRGESRTVSYDPGFKRGSSVVRVKAVSECGASDSETTFLTILGGEGADCRAHGACSITFEGLDYLDAVKEGQAAYIIPSVRNTGDCSEPITMDFYLDDQRLGRITRDVARNELFTYRFEYVPARGVHTARIVATSQCGGTGSRSVLVSVYQGGTVPPYVEPQPAPPVQAAPVTAVDVIPSYVDMKLGEGEPVTVEVTSAMRQSFMISVKGAPPEWFSYASETVVDKGKTDLYIYVSPDTTVKTTFKVQVTAESEGKVFSSDVGLYVAPVAPAGSPGLQGGGTTGLFLSDASLLVLAAFLIIGSSLVVVYLGVRKLKAPESLK